MEPLSLAIMVGAAGRVLEAVLGEGSPKLTSAIFGGLIGNRADALLCRVSRSSWNFFQNLRTKDPILNHDLERGAREAYLLATQELVRQAEARIAADGYPSPLMNSADVEALKVLRHGVEADLKTIDNVLPQPLTDAHLFLVDPAVAAADRLSRLRDSLRTNFLADSARWLRGQQVPPIVTELLEQGWEIEAPNHQRVERDWYSLIAIAFMEKLKTTPRLATIFQAKMLAEIAAREPAAASIATLEGFTYELDRITTPLQRIEDALGIVGRDIVEMKSDVLAIRDTLAPLNRIPRPVLMSSVLVVILGAVGFATDTGARTLCQVPGVRPVCGHMGVGGVPSAAEDALWRSRVAGDCETLRSYVAQHPSGAYAREAGTMLAAREQVSEETWVPAERRHAFTARTSLETRRSEDLAKNEVLLRSQTDAQTVCQPYAQGDFRLISARAAPETWRCMNRPTGYSCSFDGIVVCEVEMRRIDLVDRCR